MPNVITRKVALLGDDGRFADSMTPQAVLDAVEHVDQTAESIDGALAEMLAKSANLADVPSPAAARANPAVRTPGFIAQPGKHWPHIGDTRAQPTRLGTDLPCPDHEGQTIPCPVCRHETRACRPGELTGALRAARTDQEGEPPW